MAQYKGASKKHEISAARRRKDARLLGQKIADFFNSSDGIIFTLICLPIMAILMISTPFSGEFILFFTWIFYRKYIRVGQRAFDFPYRMPIQSKLKDASIKGGKQYGKGITYIGNDLETKEQIYASDSDLRTHMLVLGTTGSGKPQPKHAKVLTVQGWQTMGDLTVGQYVMTPDGKSAPISHIFEQGIREVWQFTTIEGSQAESTDDHIWQVLLCDKQHQHIQLLTTQRIKQYLQQGYTVKLPKITQQKESFFLTQWVAIVSIDYVGQYDCRCIAIESADHLYITNDGLITHNTEFLLGLVFNALVQNTGFIYVDGKGDPKLQKEIFRLTRYLGREDDLLIINFITSGRDFVEKQSDKVTNNMNIMGNSSSGMLVELIVALMDDSGSSGDMWKGRAISFVAALTRPLVYLRDKGHLHLSPEKYLEYFELSIIEALVWEHDGRYGEMFDTIVAPLRSYLITLPGYQRDKIKNQDTRTCEQHGYIVMQLTRIFNDLTHNYGHIFNTKVGEVDFYDVVINRRLLVVLLPALERAPDSLKMLGKMIVGSIKQMMAGCLGNRVEGVVREIIDSRPTNAPCPFYTILDEYGYYAVLGFAVAPAQARSLGFSVIFAAQDFSSLKKSSPEEAESTWENTNVRVVGRITSGQESETWKRIQGASGEAMEAVSSGFERRMGGINEHFYQQDNVTIERRQRLHYDDLSMQENGEFTFLIGKKERSGYDGGVRVIRGMGFYTAGPSPKEMRINDFVPVASPESLSLPDKAAGFTALLNGISDGSFAALLTDKVHDDPILMTLRTGLNANAQLTEEKLASDEAAVAMLGWFLYDGKITSFGLQHNKQENDG